MSADAAKAQAGPANSPEVEAAFRAVLPERVAELLDTYRDDERVRAEPFDAVELELGFLWER